jgi:predicted nucleic acid-binding protein
VAEVLILDAEALSALAHATARSVAAARARAILAVAHEHRALVRVPSAVLAEVCRGGARDAAVNRVLASGAIAIVNLDAAIARRAGALLAAAKMSSAHAVDAFVVATAAALGRAIVATGDPDDIGRLAAREPHVSVYAL